MNFKPEVRARIYKLTSQIVDDALEIVVVGEVVSRPIVREPLGTWKGFVISANDMDEATALAAKLRQGWVIPALRVV